MEKILQKVFFCAALVTGCFETVYSQENGVIVTERGEQKGIISFLSDATVDLGDGKYVDGYAKKYGAGAFLFPVGDGGSLRPFSATGDEVLGAYFRVSPGAAALPAGAPFSTSARSSDISAISALEYWDIDGGNPSKITLTWDAASGVSSLTGSDLKKLTIVGWNSNSGQWNVVASAVDANAIQGGSSNAASGSITSNSLLAPSSYTVYALAGLKADPLPVAMVSFTAMSVEHLVHLDWRTSMEHNSRNFEIERSSDGKDWNQIGTVQAAKNTSSTSNYQFIDKEPLIGANVYRLKMIDQDLTFTYSKLAAVDFGRKIEIYPNPAHQYIFIKSPGSGDPIVSVSIVDMSGKSVMDSGVPGKDGINVSSLGTGSYALQLGLSSGSKISHKIVIVR